MDINATGTAELVEYQWLATHRDAAAISLLSNLLPNSVLLQLARIDTGSGSATSAYAVYREGPMTFEASAKLAAMQPAESLESLLRQLTEEPAFLASVLLPLKAQVDQHFAARRAPV